MEVALNYGTFGQASGNVIQGPWTALSNQELFSVDGGAWGAKQWTACGLIVAGAACGVVGIWCPALWGGTAKSWGTAAAILGAAGGITAIG